MSESRDIIFSAPMVRALLETPPRKSQTRRIVKPQPEGVLHEPEEGFVNLDDAGYFAGRQRYLAGDPCNPHEEVDWIVFPVRCPYRPGGLLYAKEAVTRSGGLVQYVADGYTSRSLTWPAHWKNDPQSARFMPRRFARIWLEIVEVRCQRLQEISEEDAKAEGVEPLIPGHGPVTLDELRSDPGMRTPRMYRDGFSYAWSEMHDKPAEFGKSWRENSWVWAITFKPAPAPAPPPHDPAMVAAFGRGLAKEIAEMQAEDEPTEEP